MSDAPVRVTINLTDKATPGLNKFVLAAVRNFKTLETQSEKVGASLGRTARTVDRLSTSFDKMESEAKQAAGGLRSTGQAASTAQKGMTGVATSAGSATKAVKDNNRSMTSLIGTAAQVLPIYTAVGAALNLIKTGFSFAGESIVGFDKAMIETAAISKDVRDNFAEVRKSIIDLRPELGSTTEIAQGLFETMQAGISTGQSLKDNLNFTATAALLSKAAFSDVTTSVNVLSAAMSAYGANIDRAEEFSDILFQTVELGQIRLSELNTTLGRVLPVSAALGVSFKDVGATLATLTQGGFTTAQAGTALRTVFANVIQEADAFAAAGIDVNKVLGEKGMLGLMEAIQGATGGAAGEVRKFIPNIRGTVAALGLVNNQLGALGTNLKEFEGGLGQAARAAKIAKTSISESFDTMTAAIDRMIQRATGDKGAGLIAKLFSDIGHEINATSQQAAQAGGGFDTLRNAFHRGSVAMDAVLLTTQKLRLAQATLRLQTLKGLDAIGADFGLRKKQEQQIERIKASIVALTQIQAESQAKIKGLGDAIGANTPLLLAQADALERVDKQQQAVSNSMNLVRASQGGLKTGQILLNEQWERSGKLNEHMNASMTQSRNAALLMAKGLETAGDEVTQILNGQITLEKAIKAVTGAFVNAADTTKATREEYVDLADAFATSVLKSRDLLNTLTSIGVSADNLSGKTRNLSADTIKNATAMGFQSDEVLNLVDKYIIAGQETNHLAGQMTKLGVDTTKLTNQLVTAAAVTEKAIDPMKKLAIAMELITGESKDKIKKMNNEFQALKTAFDAGAISANILKERMTKLIKESEKFGKKAPAQYRDLRLEMKQTGNVTRTLEEAYMALNGISLEDAKRATEEFGNNMIKMGEWGVASRDEIVAAMKRIKEETKAQIGDGVNVVIDGLLHRLERLGEANLTVAGSFAETGVQTKKMAEDTQEAAEKIARTVQLQFLTMQDSGKASGQGLVDFYNNTVLPAFEASGERIPSNLIVGYSKAETQMRVELARSGRQGGEDLGRALVDGVDNVVRNSIGQVINTIENRFAAVAQTIKQKLDAIAGGTTDSIQGVRFATERAGLEQNLADLKKLMSGIRGATGAAVSSREQLNKAIREVQARLAALSKEERAAASEAERMSNTTTNSFNSVTASVNTASTATARYSREATSASRQATRAADVIARGFGTAQTAVDSFNTSSSSLSIGIPSLDSGGGGGTTDFTRNASQTIETASGNQQITGGGTQVGINPFGSNQTQQAVPSFEGYTFFPGLGYKQDDTPQRTVVSRTQSASGFGSSSNATITPTRFQTGTIFAQQGQVAQLEAGERILTAIEASQMKGAASGSVVNGGQGAAVSGSSIVTGPQTGGIFVRGGRIGSVSFPSRVGHMVVPQGFSFVPGMGNIPALQLAAATGRLSDVAGPTAQKELQRTIIPMVRSSITRRDLTRDIQGATSLTNKGKPSTGGS